MWFSTGNEASSISKQFLNGDRLVMTTNSRIATSGSLGYPYDAVLQLAVSDNLIDWSYVGLPIGSRWVAGGFGNGRYIIFGWIFTDNPEGSASISAYSDDGVTWKVGPRFESRIFFNYRSPQLTSNSIIYGNNVFVAPTANVVLYSTDGASWQSTPTIHPSNQIPQERAFGNGIFIYKTSDNALTYYTSTNGISWTTRSFPSVPNAFYSSSFSGISDITFNGGVFIAMIGSEKRISNNREMAILKSTDGINWSVIPSLTLPAGVDIQNFSSVSIDDSGTYAFFAGFPNGYRLHIPTNSWQTSDSNHYSTAISGFSNGKFFTISGTSIATSLDGLSWTRYPNVFPWTDPYEQMLVLDGQHP